MTEPDDITPAADHGAAEQTPAGRRPEDDAADLGLAVVAEATAIVEGDAEAMAVSDQNVRDVVEELSDLPLTERQEEIVAALGAMGGSIAAGVSSALAHHQDRDPHEVLRGAAESIQRQRELADRQDDQPGA